MQALTHSTDMLGTASLYAHLSAKIAVRILLARSTQTGSEQFPTNYEKTLRRLAAKKND